MICRRNDLSCIPYNCIAYRETGRIPVPNISATILLYYYGPMRHFPHQNRQIVLHPSTCYISSGLCIVLHYYQLAAITGPTTTSM